MPGSRRPPRKVVSHAQQADQINEYDAWLDAPAVCAECGAWLAHRYEARPCGTCHCTLCVACAHAVPDPRYPDGVPNWLCTPCLARGCAGCAAWPSVGGEPRGHGA